MMLRATLVLCSAIVITMVSGAEAQLWEPDMLGGDLILWLDGKDTSTITETSGLVSQWNDGGQHRAAIAIG